MNREATEDDTIVISYENEILGNGEFWRGPPSRIHECRNICGREIGALTAQDGQPHRDGMWRSRLERAASKAMKEPKA